jgi:hypothetical protein
MPWRGSPWYPFDVDTILIAAPAAPGVYVLRTEQVWIYVGESEHLADDLLAQTCGADPCLARVAPTLFGYKRVSGEARKQRQRDLIGEYRPTCNPR